MTGWPSVGVVIPTRDRPGPLRAAVDAVLAQDYPGPVRAVVVYDRAEPALPPGDRVAVPSTTGRRGWPGRATPASWRWTPT